ncbi:MAG: hypothetical protein DRJ10_11255, partial [Bacteroidetes bacterium]
MKTKPTYQELEKEVKMLHRELSDKSGLTQANLLDNIMHSSTDISVAATDIDLNVIFFNPRAEEIFGYKASEVIGKNLTEIHAMEKVEFSRIEKAIEIVKKHTKYVYYVNSETPKGAIHLKSTVSGIWDTKKQLAGFVLFTEDITARINAEKIIQESEEQLRSIFENMQDVYYKLDANGKILLASPSAVELYKCNSLDEIIGKQASDFVYDEMDNEEFIKELQKKGSIKNYIIKHKRKNGEPVFVETSTNLIFDEYGKLEGAVGIFQDITERLQAKEKAEEDEAIFSAITNQSVEGITVADMDGNYVFVNPAFCKMSGYSAEELLKLTVFDMKAKDQPQQSFYDSKEEMESLPIRVSLQKKDKTEYLTEIVGKVIKVDNKELVLGIIRD